MLHLALGDLNCRSTLSRTVVGIITSEERCNPVSPRCSKLMYECDGYTNAEFLACVLHSKSSRHPLVHKYCDFHIIILTQLVSIGFFSSVDSPHKELSRTSLKPSPSLYGPL
ncbi:hypothetical protein EG68_01073 [Paragonimus skrjabini miyazakii]|uniref:Uncharacterized protein n=1 Tax=Paragonimus skrjabini miyazakii TaxID=59628 RepID=A0A8S9Z4Z3_9TREM|nr:hypothetical protein EG68_01073 [Paragonimus skrjabini miyazakii]